MSYYLHLILNGKSYHGVEIDKELYKQLREKIANQEHTMTIGINGRKYLYQNCTIPPRTSHKHLIITLVDARRVKDLEGVDFNLKFDLVIAE